jgi:probable F420-dependent oxidoreductase
MLLNALFPTRDIGTDPAKIRDWAQAAEGLGYHCIEVADHVFGAAPRGDWKPVYSEADPFHETFTTMAFLAAVTKTINLCSGVLILPQRQTGVVAKQAAEVDILSGGRLRLGVGVGWNHVEYEALGQDFRTRGARQEEQIELLRRLFTEPVVDFSGRFDRVDRAALIPKPTRQIPIWLGGFSEVAFERGARLADGFIFGDTVDRAASTLKRMRDRRESLGKPVEDFGASYMARPKDSLDELVADVEAWREAGGTHVSLVTMGQDLDSAEGHVDYLASAADALGVS